MPGPGGATLPTAWLSLDAAENDPARFLAYLLAALQTIAPHMGQGVLAVLDVPQPPPLEALLTTVLNDIASLPDGFILVLDDYHTIDAQFSRSIRRGRGTRLGRGGGIWNLVDKIGTDIARF